MLTTLDKINALDSDTPKPFGGYQEEAIISLALDHPEFFVGVGHFLKPEMFGRLECRYLIAQILNAFEKFEVVPTRKWLRDLIEHELTVDDPHESIMAILDRPSNHREVPMVKDTLLKWAKDRAFGLLYDETAIAAYHSGDFAYLEGIVNQANRIQDVGDKGFWFFENLELLFQKDIITHLTTGFPKLDRFLNNGGPSPKEVVCYLAATNVGKSILLCNTAISSLKGINRHGLAGQDVLLITFELDTIKTAMRCLGSATGVPIDQIHDREEYLRRYVEQMQRSYGKRFLIHEMPPDECSVSHIYALLDNLRRIENWHPDVIILDYLDLMVSRNQHYNKDDYTRQKHVSNEIRGLAKNEDVLVFTATQTNRSGADSTVQVDLTKSAESFGKIFPLDYVIGLQQSDSDRAHDPPRIQMFIAKNRNGPKHEIITCEIHYNTMVVRELL